MQVKKKSQKQESSVAKELGGKTVVASGAKWFADSDVRNDKFLVECKTTSKDYFSVTTNLWEKILKEAVKDHGRTPIMVIDLLHDSVNESERYVIFGLASFDSVPKPYEAYYVGGGDDDKKSLRITSGIFDELSEDSGIDIKGAAFAIKAETIPNKVRHILFLTTMDIFKDFYKEEI